MIQHGFSSGRSGTKSGGPPKRYAFFPGRSVCHSGCASQHNASALIQSQLKSSQIRGLTFQPPGASGQKMSAVRSHRRKKKNIFEMTEDARMLPRVLTCRPTRLRRLHQVKSSVLLHQFLPLPGLNQTVDHSPQRVPVQAEAPPTAALHETGSLLPTAHEKCTNLNVNKHKHYEELIININCYESSQH